MELNAEQIKKALECCANGGGCIRDGCPLYKDDEFGDIEKCTSELSKNALALIKELAEELVNCRTDNVKLTEENARLKHFDLEAMRGKADSYKELCSKYLEENERLKSENDILLNIKNLNIDKVIADTVRKMKERLTLEFDRLHKSNFMTPKVRQWIINQIAKEMLEGEK